MQYKVWMGCRFMCVKVNWDLNYLQKKYIHLQIQIQKRFQMWMSCRCAHMCVTVNEEEHICNVMGMQRAEGFGGGILYYQ